LVAADPKNTAAREVLIRLYVTDLDQPEEAAKLLTPETAEQLRTYVPLAAKAVEETPKQVCLEMGDWYQSLSAAATTTGKTRALSRARAYYQRFVELEKDPIKAAVGKAKVEQIEKEAAKAEVTPGNIALRAKVSASSEFSADFKAALAIDGVIPPPNSGESGNVWAAKGGFHPDGVTFTLVWPEIVTVGEIVYFGGTRTGRTSRSAWTGRARQSSRANSSPAMGRNGSSYLRRCRPER
jgi:hypothetical protein